MFQVRRNVTPPDIFEVYDEAVDENQNGFGTTKNEQVIDSLFSGPKENVIVSDENECSRVELGSEEFKLAPHFCEPSSFSPSKSESQATGSGRTKRVRKAANKDLDQDPPRSNSAASINAVKEQTKKRKAEELQKNAGGESAADNSRNNKKQKQDSASKITVMTLENIPETMTEVSGDDFLQFSTKVVEAALENDGKLSQVGIHYVCSVALSFRGLLTHSNKLMSEAGHYDQGPADGPDMDKKYSVITAATEEDWNVHLLDELVKKTGLKKEQFATFDKISEKFFAVKLCIKEKRQKQQIYVRLMPRFTLTQLQKLVIATNLPQLKDLDMDVPDDIITLLRRTFMETQPPSTDSDKFGLIVKDLARTHLINAETAPGVDVDHETLLGCKYMRALSSMLVLSSLVTDGATMADNVMVHMLNVYLGHIDVRTSKWYTRFVIYDRHGNKRFTIWTYNDGRPPGIHRH